MNEDFLQFIWRFKYFDQLHLTTSDGRPIKIIHQGQQNFDAGPDFLHGKIQIGEQTWHGHIELHIAASEWHKHQHSTDPNYDNVILHVVYTSDKKVYYNNGNLIPTLELQGRIPTTYIRNYTSLMEQMSWIPCSGIITNHFSELRWTAWSERLVVERLINKTDQLKNLYHELYGDWELIFYHWLSYGFGLRVNADTFMSLARRVHPSLVAKYRDQPHLVDAIFYGAADMLSDKFKDDYPKKLKSDWDFLKQKHQLEHHSPLIWKYHRMRPASFPTLRISQFVNLWLTHTTLASQIIETQDIKALSALFQLKANEYWHQHTKFDHVTKSRSIQSGNMFTQQLLVNVIVPYVFFYGHHNAIQELKDRSINWLQYIKAENNSIMRRWKNEGVSIKHAADSQALYHLKKNYCDKKECISCSFGHSILKIGI